MQSLPTSSTRQAHQLAESDADRDDQHSTRIPERQQTTANQRRPFRAGQRCQVVREPAAAGHGDLERERQAGSVDVAQAHVRLEQVVHADLRLDQQTHQRNAPVAVAPVPEQPQAGR